MYNDSLKYHIELSISRMEGKINVLSMKANAAENLNLGMSTWMHDLVSSLRHEIFLLKQCIKELEE